MPIYDALALGGMFAGWLAATGSLVALAFVREQRRTLQARVAKAALEARAFDSAPSR
jgi:hypothetical protein